MKLNKYESLFFDLDGVLWNSNVIHENAFRYTFKKFGIKFLGYEKLAGRRTDEVFQEILRNVYGFVDQELLIELVKTKREYASFRLMRSPPIWSRCDELLGTLSSTHRLVLVSSSSRANVNVFLNSISNPHIFEIVLSGEDVIEAKPSPEIYELAQKKILIDKSKCLVIEDSIYGIEAANKAGIECVALIGTHPYLTLLEAKPSFIINSLEELFFKE